MAVLLVGLSVMAILMTVAMPVWSQMARREKEAELVFRGEQYARAIGLFQRRAGPGVSPPNLGVLVEQRFLRKMYKDPITGDDFLPILQSQNVQSTPQPGLPAGRGRGGQPAPPAGRGAAPPAAGGVVGVMSKSKDRSIRLYNGRNFYNEWQFVYVQQVQAPAAGAPGAGGRGQRGGQPGQPPAGGGTGRGRGTPPAGGPGRGPVFPPPRPPGN